jgi:hypothetical protein
MAGLIGADNQFGMDFDQPDPSLQGTIVAIYEVRPSFTPLALVDMRT